MFKENVYHDKNKKKQYFAGVLISKNDSVLLGMKKRGFGSGLWNHSFAGKVIFYRKLLLYDLTQ